MATNIIILFLAGFAIGLFLGMPMFRGKWGEKARRRRATRDSCGGSCCCGGNDFSKYEGGLYGESCKARAFVDDGEPESNIIDHEDFTDVSLIDRELPATGLKFLTFELAQLDSGTGIFGSFQFALSALPEGASFADAPSQNGNGGNWKAGEATCKCHASGDKHGIGVAMELSKDEIDRIAGFIKNRKLDTLHNGRNHQGEELPRNISIFRVKAQYETGEKLAFSIVGMRLSKELAAFSYDLAQFAYLRAGRQFKMVDLAMRKTFRNMPGTGIGGFFGRLFGMDKDKVKAA